MKLYLEPIVEEQEDGTIRTTLIKANTKTIDERIRNLEGFKKAQFDIDKIVGIIRKSNSSREAEESLRTTFKLTCSQAHFMMNATFEDLMNNYGSKEKWQAEVIRWKALKTLIAKDE